MEERMTGAGAAPPDGTGHDGQGVSPEYLRGWKAGRQWEKERAVSVTRHLSGPPEPTPLPDETPFSVGDSPTVSTNVSGPHSPDWHEPGPACDPLIAHYHHKASPRITWDSPEPRTNTEGHYQVQELVNDSWRDSPTVSEPRTPTGRRLVEDEPRLVTGEHDMRTRVLAIEAEAAQPIDVERLARALMKDGPDNDWHRCVNPQGHAESIAAEYARLSEEEGS